MEQEHRETQGDAVIGKLIAAAGPGETASSEARERVYANVHAHWDASVRSQARRRVQQRRFSRWRVLGMAAGVAGAAVVLYWLQGSLPTGLDNGGATIAQIARIDGTANVIRSGSSIRLVDTAAAPALAAGDRLRTGSDGGLALELADGLALRVNVDTELLLAGATDIELLSGTIYVDSGRDGAAPELRVATPLGDVRHIGTQYEVRLADSGLRIRVREGSIAYATANAEATASAGEQLDIDAAGDAARSRFASDDAAWDWASQLAALPTADRHSLDEVLAFVARERGLELVYANPDTADVFAAEVLNELSGFNPDELLSILPRAANMVPEYEIQGGSFRVLN